MKPCYRVITLAEARPFIERWHYEHACPTGRNIFFGAYLGETLYAVACYGNTANMDQGASISKLTGQSVTATNCVELRRLCRIGAQDEAVVMMTQFLSRCHRFLRFMRVDGVRIVADDSTRIGDGEVIRYILSYSDPEHNKLPLGYAQHESGGVYKAANFEYLGKTAPLYHTINAEGKVMHRRFAYKFMTRYNRAHGVPKLEIGWDTTHPDYMTMIQARAHLGLVPHRCTPRDRWFLDLGALKIRKSRLTPHSRSA